jgi:hypothetical protein
MMDGETKAMTVFSIVLLSLTAFTVVVIVLLSLTVSCERYRHTSETHQICLEAGNSPLDCRETFK